MQISSRIKELQIKANEGFENFKQKVINQKIGISNQKRIIIKFKLINLGS